MAVGHPPNLTQRRRAMAPSVMRVLWRSTADSAVDTVAVVIGLERRELPFEVEQIPEQHLVKQLLPNRADHPFDERMRNGHVRVLT